MILYKYVPFESGLKIIENNTIGFSNANDFNDPFEMQATYPSDWNNTNFINSRALKLSSWAKSYAVLSLTRQPLNSLMWAHYAKEHTGIVIGINCAQSTFTKIEGNLIPIQFGNVIYTNTKPNSKFLTKKNKIRIGGIYNFDVDCLERFQRMFLYKPMCWSYEEEVRLVKHTGDKSFDSQFKVIKHNDRPLYLYHLPPNSISEVYFGLRNDTPREQLIEKTIEHNKDCSFFTCHIDPKSWDLYKKPVKI